MHVIIQFPDIIKYKKKNEWVSMMDSQKIFSLLSKEEGTKLDFKLKLNLDTESSKKEFAKDICAIANSRGGRGYILFGIEDKTKNVLGINQTDFVEEKLQLIVSTRIDPPVPISVDIVKIQNKLVGVITIYNTEQKPHQLRESGAFYIRRGSTTDLMRKEEIASMLQETGLLSYELLPVVNATIKDLDDTKIIDFLVKSGLPEIIDREILIGTGIVSKEKESSEVYPTCGGLLLFGKFPYNFLPHAVIKIYNYYNSDLPYHHISKGTIMEMLEDACLFIQNCIDTDDFPIEVIKDCISKSLLYRDYFDINTPNEIYIHKNRIEIINPGAALKGTNNTSNYVRRNLWLYIKLLTIDKDKKYFNRDININNLVKAYGKIRYYNLNPKNLFKAVIPIKTL